MNINGGDVIAEILKKQGVSHVFTLCGGHISPILTGCRKEGITVIDVRNEATAVFAADAVSRITGTTGVAAVTAGPGLTNSITALKNAQLAQSPLLLLGGAAATIIKGRGALQDIDQISLVKPLVKYAASIRSSCDIVSIIEEALTAARSGVPGPVFVECPIDLLYDEDLVRLWYGKGSATGGKQKIIDRLLSLYLKRHVDTMYSCDLKEARPQKVTIMPGRIDEKDIARAAKKIARARKPVLIIGSQAMIDAEAAGKLPDAVEKLGAPFYLTGMARGLMGKNHQMQLLHHRKESLREADLLILAGIAFDFRLEYGRTINPDAFVISVNRSKKDLYLNRRPDLPVQADPGMFLLSLSRHYSQKNTTKGEWLAMLKTRERERETEILSKSLRKTEYINPLLLLKKLEDFLENNAVIVADGGDIVATASYILRPPGPLTWLDPGVYGTLGAGAGFALGVKTSLPDAEVWIIYGDGAAGYSIQEVDTMVRHGVPVIALIGNDASWSQIARDQIEILRDDVATRLRHSDYHLVARAYGAEGFLLDREEDIERVFTQARQAARKGKPVVINALIGTTDFRKGSVSM
ncbi:MAG TPA: thiamine pyrophosphate-binding protein [Spirochaetota bacterium]|nr:thiamine pyrophosphate-binding protein [Spirochaetota bacterium]HPI88528.1 thiamine pyrophosphate-binding protein [Spirochaetota bacterium]HPR48008.1 thiamine pyrophosphate-binding protein [Spirochaetota bacterium]